MSRSTEEVLEHHLKAFDARDVDGIVSDYDDSSVVITPSGHVLRGRSQIRPVFEAFFQELSRPGGAFTLIHKVVEGEVGFIVWTAETAEKFYDLGTDTFVIREGRIAAQTIHYSVH